MNVTSMLFAFCASIALIPYSTCKVDSEDTLCPIKKRTIRVPSKAFKEEESKILAALGVAKNNISKTYELQFEAIYCMNDATTDKGPENDGQCSFNHFTTKFTTSYRSRCVQQY